jgi:hypothetical protein
MRITWLGYRGWRWLLILEGLPVGPGYRLTFLFEPTAKRPFNDSAAFNGKQLQFARGLKDGEALFTEIEGSKIRIEDNEVLVDHDKAGIGVRIAGDAPLAHFNFFAVKSSVSIEPFVEVKLARGKEMKWRSQYSFSVKEAKNGDK